MLLGELHFPASKPNARPKACEKLPRREIFHKGFFQKVFHEICEACALKVGGGN
jgi:hypothetical protein